MLLCCFQILCLTNFSCDFLADVSSLLLISGKNSSDVIIQPQSTPFDAFGILIGQQWVISMYISQKALKKLENEGSAMFRESQFQKLEEKRISVKI